MGNWHHHTWPQVCFFFHEEVKTGWLMSESEVIPTSQVAGSYYSLCTKAQQRWAKLSNSSSLMPTLRSIRLTLWPSIHRPNETHAPVLPPFFTLLCAALQLTWCRWMHPAGESTGRWRQQCPACSESPAAPSSPRLRDMQAAVTASGVSGDL